MRIVKRTYKTKHGVVTKTYTYGHASRRGKTLVGKGGKKNTKNIQSFIDSINNNPNFSEAEKRTTINDLKTFINQRVKQGRKLTTTGFTGHRQDDEIDRLFSNFGITAEEAAAELGVSIDTIYDTDNWYDGIFSFKDEDKNKLRKFEFKRTYTENIWEEITI